MQDLRKWKPCHAHAHACRSAASNVPTRDEIREGPRLCRHHQSRKLRGASGSTVAALRRWSAIERADAGCGFDVDMALLFLEVLPVLAVSFGWPMWRQEASPTPDVNPIWS